MAMADVAGERSASLPMPASLAKRCRSPDDARPDASLKRCKRHHCHADSPVAVAADGEVDDGEIIGDAAAAAAAAAMDVDADSAARGHREGSSSRSGSDYLLQPDISRIVTKDETAGKGGVVVHGSKIMRAKGIQIRIGMTGLKVHMKGTGKTDQQLALQEQDDPVKTIITEEARRMKEAVTAKHVQQQLQKQQVEPPAGIPESCKDNGVRAERNVHPDNWDDAVGYYSYRLGELLDGRYEIKAALGKGVFSTVVRAQDLKAGKDDPQMVAVKIVRNNDTMFKAGKEEVSILGKLASAYSEDKRHCVRFISNFRYRNHLCLVFESLSMNLREVLKKFGRNIGLKLTAVRAYAKQLFIALKHLKNCKVLHCDIKLDNILLNEARNVLKLCDFGNAMLAGMNEVTPYIVSRFYRAPEIILGLPYDHPLDMWSVGCCLYELYTGEILFPGMSNNDMLRRHMELKGPFPKKMLRKGAFTMQHFNQDLNFVATEEHPVTKKAVIRLVLNIKPKGIGSKISNSHGEDPKMLSNFKDLLDKIFVLDSEKRITIAQALSHPFITGKGKKMKILILLVLLNFAFTLYKI